MKPIKLYDISRTTTVDLDRRILERKEAYPRPHGHQDYTKYGRRGEGIHELPILNGRRQILSLNDHAVEWNPPYSASCRTVAFAIWPYSSFSFPSTPFSDKNLSVAGTISLVVNLPNAKPFPLQFC